MKTFEEKLKSMTAKDVVLAMVEGLEKEWVKVDMGSFGEDSRYYGICCGCAATNAICQITGKAFDFESITQIDNRSNFVNSSYETLVGFEYAVDNLRTGNLRGYNYRINKMGWFDNLLLPEKIIQYYDYMLPSLETRTYKEGLTAYRDFANLL